MSDEVLSIDRNGAVATVTLNRPRAKNALDAALTKALGAALVGVGKDESVRVVVLTGAGGSFCAGADLKAAIVENPAALENPGEAIDALPRDDPRHRRTHRSRSSPRSTAPRSASAAISALACDLRVLSADAYLQEKFVKIGLMPDGGGTFWLPRLVGLGRAMELILTRSRPSTPRRLWRSASPIASSRRHRSREATMAFAQELAKGPPLAFAEIKRAVRIGLGGTIDDALEPEKHGQARCLKSNDCMEGVMAWMQKREPVFQGK